MKTKLEFNAEFEGKKLRISGGIVKGDDFGKDEVALLYINLNEVIREAIQKWFRATFGDTATMTRTLGETSEECKTKMDIEDAIREAGKGPSV